MAKDNYSRRDFIKTGSVAGLLGIAGISGIPVDLSLLATNPTAKVAIKVPRRVFGKTKVQVSVLGMGGMYDITTNLIIAKKAYDWGINYWDTAAGYNGGNSETGIGMFFEKFPETRKDIFLVTKSGDMNPEGMTKLLQRSLDRMKTSYIDLYFLHGIRSIDPLTPAVKIWAEKMKNAGKIRYFGVSTHSNMADLLDKAADLGWIDGIMLTYNFRFMTDDKMNKAIDKCVKAGIGLTAMKTQGVTINSDSEADMKLAGHFITKGYTPFQAKLKAVWGDKRISSICSQMPNLTVLSANVAAAVDKKALSLNDYQMLREYAKTTCDSYCAGCNHLCSFGRDSLEPIADVMRCLMYYKGYGNLELAQSTYKSIPESVRDVLNGADVSVAEMCCPHQIKIGERIQEARVLFG